MKGFLFDVPSHQPHRFVLLHFDDDLVLEEVGAMTYQLKLRKALSFGLVNPLSIPILSAPTTDQTNQNSITQIRESWRGGHVALAACGHALTACDCIRPCCIQDAATDNLSWPP